MFFTNQKSNLQINNYIEHTLLKVNCVQTQIAQIIKEANQYKFYGICIPPHYVPYAKKMLKNKAPKLISVAGFPLGYQNYKVKCKAINVLAQNGANEVDVVTNIAAIKNKEWEYVLQEWKAIIKTAKANNLPIKIIIESALMEKEELLKLCQLANELQPNFIKTSTGFNGDGAELNKVIFLREHLNGSIQIKASGGIKNAQQATAFINAGANRIGTSSGVKILTE